jgi:hypothetical protein
MLERDNMEPTSEKGIRLPEMLLDRNDYLTLWRRVTLEKLTVAELVKKFSVFYTT